VTENDVLAQLKKFGSDQTKKTLLKHGAREPFFGVKVADLKALQKAIKTDHALALALYDTGNADAMYLAGLIADPAAMTKADLRKWAKGAYWYMLSRFTVPWVAAESRFGRELALEWLDAGAEPFASTGWSTYSSLLAITPDAGLNLGEIETLLDRVTDEIGGTADGVRYAMNNFVISVGSYVAPLTAKAKATAKAVGAVAVDAGDTECRVPDAAAAIAKIELKGRVGQKRKRAAC
jgi:hypothetical protein